MADGLDEEQIEYIEKEYFAGFKRFGNWKSLLISLSNELPAFLKNVDVLQNQFDNELENLNFIKNKLLITYHDKINDRKSFAKFQNYYSKNKSNYKTSIKKSLLESIDNLELLTNELLQKESITHNDTCEQLITLFDKSVSNLTIIDGKLNNTENNINLATSIINDFIDDKDGITYKNIKKSSKEIDKEKEEAKADAKRLAKLECSIHAHLSADDEAERAEFLEKEFLEKISPIKESRVTRNKNECINYLSSYLDENNNTVEDYQSHCSNTLKSLIDSIQLQYMSDDRPWVIGYSGGKDSSAVVTVVYLALLTLDENLRNKKVYVVASDTLVETPLVVDHINKSLEQIGNQARRDGLPITTHKVLPKPDKTFWTCLLGKGYPAPTQSFRWCTERMKINPVSDFITDKVAEFEEVIVVLGSRSQESASRAQVIAKHKIANTRLARHTTLPNAFIYTPIDTWSMDDVWKSLRCCKLDVTSSNLGVGKNGLIAMSLNGKTHGGGRTLRFGICTKTHQTKANARWLSMIVHHPAVTLVLVAGRVLLSQKTVQWKV